VRTGDAAVWIGHLRDLDDPRNAGLKLPATSVLSGHLSDVPEGTDDTGYREIGYRRDGDVGAVRFRFYNGAMSTAQSRRLEAALRHALAQDTKVLVLRGGQPFSNGIHLGVIEAAGNPADASWANVQAMNDVVEAVLTTTDRLVVAALPGNAAAGGVMLALAADEVWCRTGVVLNPHYRLMGLYGSEYWTYTLPRRVGADAARRLTRDALPVSSTTARDLGLVDRLVDCAPADFADKVAALALRSATGPGTWERIAAKKARLEREWAATPPAAYRAAELARMREQFFDPHATYHALRRAFVRKERPAATPSHLTALSG
jgi:putative two-component system protein, hydrogenase maturation factor HypX/HoxX